MASLDTIFMRVHRESGAARPHLLSREAGPYRSRTMTKIIFIEERKRGNIATDIESWKRVYDDNIVDKAERLWTPPCLTSE